VLRIDHVNLHARDGVAMVAFLEQVLDVKEGFRPPFGNRGHWLYLDGHPAIHIDVVARDADYPKGLVDHLAFGVYDYATILGRVETCGYRFEHAGIPGTDIGQIFVYGPEGIKLELQYRRAADRGIDLRHSPTAAI
jgi:catechol 2,3-dioxygenase-like lactoylglutathione lyase family enzyme